MATGSFRRQTIIGNILRHIYTVLRWIIEPSASMEKKQRRRVRLLSIFLLLITINTLIGATILKNAGNSSWPIMLVTAAILAAGYVLSRTGHYGLATIIAVTIPAFPILTMALFSANQANIPQQLPWLAVPLLVCSLLLSLRHTIIIAISYIFIIALLIPFVDVPTANLAQSLAFMFMIFFFVVAVTAVRQRDQSEIEHQLTERKRVKESLEKERHDFRLIIDSSPIIVFYKDNEGRFVRVNKAFAEALKMPEEEFLGKTVFDLYSAKIAQGMTDADQEILKSGQPKLNIIEQYESSSGLRWVQTDKIPIFGKNGIPVGLVGFAQDITERKRVEKASDERVKELSCLYGIIAKIFEKQDITLDELYQEITNLLPQGWQYPETTCARVSVNGKIFETENFKDTKWWQSADIKAYGEKIGSIEVYYLKEKPEIDEGPFLKEERYLIDATAKHLGKTTERKRVEKELRESEEKSRTFMETASDLMNITDKDGIFTYVNDSMARTLGYSKEELIGMHITQLLSKESLEKDFKPNWGKFITNGEISIETTFLTKEGKEICCEIKAVAVYDTDGNYTGTRAVNHDITERKKSEQLQNDENYVLTLLGQGAELSELLDAILRLGEYHDPSIKGSVLLADPSGERLFQASAPSLPDDYNELFENGIPIGQGAGTCGTAAYLKERVIATDIENSPLFKPLEEVVKRTTNNGLLSCWSEPIISSNGDLLGTIANYSNKLGEPDADNLRVLEWSARIAAIAIERKRAEEALANEAIRRRILIEQSGDGIVVLDQNGNVYESNQRFAEMLGYSPEEVRQLHVWDWEFLVPREQVLDMIRSVDETGDHFETQHRRKDGTVYDVEISTNGAVFAGEKLIFCICRDITERKKHEEIIKQALSDLEHSSAQLTAANKGLEAFSYSVSHDLRAPLRSIDGFSQALLEDYPDKLDEQGNDYLRRLRTASQKMGELIDGLLKLSRLTRSEMNEEEVDLSKLAQEITTRLQQTQPERQVDFVISGGLTARGDSQLLRAALENLLGNAWKFTGKRQQARIEFGTTRNGDKKAYFVRDNGAGFDMTYADKLFGAFQRLHDTTEFPGTGIGLATVQRIIHRHGGSVWAEGAAGEGATFYFTLS